MAELSSMVREMVKLIETASASIFGVDSTGLINGWNRKISELMVLKDSEAIGKSLINDIVSDDSRQMAEDIVGKVLQGEEGLDAELKLKKFKVKHQNSDLYTSARAYPSRDTSNNVVWRVLCWSR